MMLLVWASLVSSVCSAATGDASTCPWSGCNRDAKHDHAQNDTQALLQVQKGSFVKSQGVDIQSWSALGLSISYQKFSWESQGVKQGWESGPQVARALFATIGGIQMAGDGDWASSVVTIGQGVVPLVSLVNPVIGLTAGIFLSLFSPSKDNGLQALHDQLVKEMEQYVTEVMAQEAFKTMAAALTKVTNLLDDGFEYVKDPPSNLNKSAMDDYRKRRADFWLGFTQDMDLLFADVFDKDCIQGNSPVKQPPASCLAFANQGAFPLQAAFATQHLSAIVEYGRCSPSDVQKQQKRNIEKYRHVYSQLLGASLYNWITYSRLPTCAYSYPKGWGDQYCTSAYSCGWKCDYCSAPMKNSDASPPGTTCCMVDPYTTQDMAETMGCTTTFRAQIDLRSPAQAQPTDICGIAETQDTRRRRQVNNACTTSAFDKYKQLWTANTRGAYEGNLRAFGANFEDVQAAHPTCKLYSGAVWAFCGDASPVVRWGLSPAGATTDIGNCNHAASVLKKWGSCPAASMLVRDVWSLTLNACQGSCTGDSRCKGISFTFNEGEDPSVANGTCDLWAGCLPPQTDITDWGWPTDSAGWYDVQGCGECNDYCRWVGNIENTDDLPPPARHTSSGSSRWSCALAGANSQYTGAGAFGATFEFVKCNSPGSQAGWKYLVGSTNGVPVKCAGPNQLQCASEDGQNCLWGSFPSLADNPWAVVIGVTSRRPVVVACPGWATASGEDACKTLACYVDTSIVPPTPPSLAAPTVKLQQLELVNQYDPAS